MTDDRQDGLIRRDDSSSRREPLPPAEDSDPDGSCVEEVEGGVTIEWHGVEPSDTAEETSSGDGWYDLPDGAEPFTPEQMTPDRGFLISEFMPDRYDTPGHGYAEPGSEDPESPKARLRRDLVARNRDVYEDPQADAHPVVGESPADEDS